MPNPWTGKGNPYTRKEVVERLRATLKKGQPIIAAGAGDRKSTRLNSSHSSISYAVFCLKKKKTPREMRRTATVVGRVPIAGVATSEVLVQPNGKAAYVGTVLGHDQFYALDSRSHTNPIV